MHACAGVCSVPDSWVRRPGDNDPVVILQTQHWACVPSQNLQTLQTLFVPDLWKTEVEGMEWNEGHTGRQQQRKRENKRSAKGNKCGSRWEHPILSAVFLPHLASLFWTFRSSLRQPPQYARTHAHTHTHGCLPFVPLGYKDLYPCLYVNRYRVTSVYFWRHTYLNWIVPKATDDLVIVILETVNSFTIFWATLNPL